MQKNSISIKNLKKKLYMYNLTVNLFTAVRGRVS